MEKVWFKAGALLIYWFYFIKSEGANRRFSGDYFLGLTGFILYSYEGIRVLWGLTGWRDATWRSFRPVDIALDVGRSSP